MNRQQNTITPLGIALLLLFLLCCGGIYYRATHSSGHLGTLERIQAGGVVRIGYANEAPYGYKDSETGEITGEAPEIAKLILERLGVEEENVEAVVTEFGSLIPGLKARRFDIIAAGMYITPERAEQIHFSNPTYAIGEAFLVAEGNPLNLHSFSDVATNPAARLGVMGGSIEHRFARDAGVPEDQIVQFPEYPNALAGLNTGRVDAVALTQLTAEDLLEKSAGAAIEIALVTPEPGSDSSEYYNYGAFGMRLEDETLLRAFNAELEQFIGSPEHLELVEPFGFTPEKMPGDVTTEQLLEGG